MPNDLPQSDERTVQVAAGSVVLEATLGMAPQPRGLVAFAHGSGSSRHSSRNRFVAEVLRKAGLATLLVDLLTAEEEAVDIRTQEFRFDIDLLARRMVGVTDWLTGNQATNGLPIGLFGASTGAAAALIAAAERQNVRAVVSRGGRPDLAERSLRDVTAPVLLIVGGNDEVVIDLNEQAQAQLTQAAKKELVIVPGASHLFEEPGTLEEVARLAADWFTGHLDSA